MSTQNTTENPYAAALVDLRKKRVEIDNAIKVLEAMSGLKLTDVPALNVGAAEGPKTGSNDKLDEGSFLGMSIVDAAKKLLSIRKRQMGNKEIAKELAAGGLVMNSADPVNTVGSIMTRRFNQAGDVVRVGRGTWGLKEWYPNRTFKTAGKASSSQEEEKPEKDDNDSLGERYEAKMAEIQDLGLGGDDGTKKNYDF